MGVKFQYQRHDQQEQINIDLKFSQINIFTTKVNIILQNVNGDYIEGQWSFNGCMFSNEQTQLKSLHVCVCDRCTPTLCVSEFLLKIYYTKTIFLLCHERIYCFAWKLAGLIMPRCS